jgi:cytoskeletal protein RodZ
MNIAGKGVLLIVAVITIGVIVLNEGFSDNAAVSSDPLTSNQETQEQEQEQELEQEQEQESSSSSEETTEAVQDNADSETNEQSPATSTSVLHPPAEVRVLVANGTEVTGAAGATLDTLVATAGYNGVKAVNDTGDEVLLETFVYYGQGYDLDAQNVRLIINADSRNVLPMPETLPIDDLSDANVLVHVGSDLFPDQGG